MGFLVYVLLVLWLLVTAARALLKFALSRNCPYCAEKNQSVRHALPVLRSGGLLGAEEGLYRPNLSPIRNAADHP